MRELPTMTAEKPCAKVEQPAKSGRTSAAGPFVQEFLTSSKYLAQVPSRAASLLRSASMRMLCYLPPYDAQMIF